MSSSCSHAQPTATASHPPPQAPDPTTAAANSESQDGTSQGRQPTTHAASSTELAGLKVDLRNGLRQFPDFPSPGVLFEDIMPLFASPKLHASLIRALELQLVTAFPETSRSSKSSGIDVIVGLESRGFLFGPTLALQLGSAFVPVRKKGKLPGSCETEAFEKEYGQDLFQIQSDAISNGQKVVIMDDIIATGGSAAAAGRLVRKLGGDLLGFVFLMELDFLKGRDRLDAPVQVMKPALKRTIQRLAPVSDALTLHHAWLGPNEDMTWKIEAAEADERRDNGDDTVQQLSS